MSIITGIFGDGKGRTSAKATDRHFNEVFRELYPRMLRFASKQIRDKEIAKDIVQDAFMAYLKHLERLSQDLPAIATFIYRTIWFLVNKHHRSDKVAQKYILTQNPEPIHDEHALNDLLNVETYAELHKAIGLLPKGCKLVTEMSLELSNREIANELKISIKTVQSQRTKGLGLLRKLVPPTVALLFPICHFLR